MPARGRDNYVECQADFVDCIDYPNHPSVGRFKFCKKEHFKQSCLDEFGERFLDCLENEDSD